MQQLDHDKSGGIVIEKAPWAVWNDPLYILPETKGLSRLQKPADDRQVMEFVRAIKQIEKHKFRFMALTMKLRVKPDSVALHE